jgi:hypothetical protein
MKKNPNTPRYSVWRHPELAPTPGRCLGVFYWRRCDMAKEKELKFKDYKYLDNIIKIHMEVDLKLPCVICGEKPQDVEEGLELLVKDEWVVICGPCAANHAEVLTEVLNNNKRHILLEMEALHRVIFEVQRIRMELGREL